jgi:hypothetical protein
MHSQKLRSTRSTFHTALHTARNIAALQQSMEVGTVDLLFALELQNDATSLVLRGLLQSSGRGILPCFTSFPSVMDPFLPVDPATVHFTRPANKVLITAYAEAATHGFADRNGKLEVTTEHLLVALADVEPSESRGLLSHCGVGVQKIRGAVYEWMS